MDFPSSRQSQDGDGLSASMACPSSRVSSGQALRRADRVCCTNGWIGVSSGAISATRELSPAAASADAIRRHHVIRSVAAFKRAASSKCSKLKCHSQRGCVFRSQFTSSLRAGRLGPPRPMCDSTRDRHKIVQHRRLAAQLRPVRPK